MLNLIRPIKTEKSMGQVARSQYTFAIPQLMTKSQVRAEMEKVYGIKVAGVSTIHMHGKMHKTGKKSKSVRSSDWKKAIITIKGDQKVGELATLFEISGGTK